jgi:hypothetical protein
VTVVPGYRVDRRIGAGGVGDVFAAEEEASGRAVALKILHAAADDAEAAARLEREAHAANVVSRAHPGIVPVLAYGRLGDGRRYLVLPLLVGRNLREKMDAEGPLSAAAAWEIARQAAEALGAAHAAGIVHRDVKPENVFLEDGGRVRLLDFGLAKRTEDAEVSRLTKTGAVLGTPAYMAPEQWWSAPIDERTDQYALGAMLFEMIAGRPPFEGGSFAELLQKHLHDPVPPLSGELDAFVGRLLRKDKADRFASMADVVREGDRAVGRPAEATKQSQARARDRAGMSTAIVLVVGLALLWGVGYAGDIRRNVGAWFVGGGLALQVVTTMLAVAAVVALLRMSRPRAPRVLPWLVLGPAFVGIAVTYIGWASVMRSVDRAPPLHRLDILHEGLFEANLCRFWGFGLSATVLAAFAVLRAGARHPAHVLERRMATLGATALVAAVALSRLEAREAAAWASDAIRIDRVHEILEAAVERRLTVGCVLVVLGSSLGIFGWRIWRDRSVVRKTAIPLAVAIAVAAGADAWLEVRIGDARAAVRAELAPQFALFAKLDPPSVVDQPSAGPPPEPSTALQVSSVMLAIDGVPVAPLAALASAPGRAHVGEEIDRALAKAAARGTTAKRVALMVDREVAFGAVRLLLARARASGVDTADVFLTRGPSPDVPANAPAEAALVKASDFVTRVMVFADDGEQFPDDAPFHAVARRLELAGGRTRVAISTAR